MKTTKCELCNNKGTISLKKQWLHPKFNIDGGFLGYSKETLSWSGNCPNCKDNSNAWQNMGFYQAGSDYKKV